MSVLAGSPHSDSIVKHIYLEPRHPGVKLVFVAGCRPVIISAHQWKTASVSSPMKERGGRLSQHGDDNNIQYNNDPVDGLYNVTCPQRVMGFFQTEVIEKYKPEGAKK